MEPPLVGSALEHPVNGAVSHHYIHALDYLVYAHLQQGEDEQAEAVIEEAMAKDRHQATFPSAFHAASMAARIAVEQRDWERAAALEPRVPDYLPWEAYPWSEALTWYARGLGAAHGGDQKVAAEAEARMVELRDRARADGDEAMATYIEIDRLVLAGRLAHLQGDEEEAVELTRSAAELEGTVEKHPVTPGALQPPYEALGNLLLELDRPAEALEAYEASDATWPGRYHTLLGAAQAAEQAGDEEAARRYYDELLTIAGDSPRAEIDEARARKVE